MQELVYNSAQHTVIKRSDCTNVISISGHVTKSDCGNGERNYIYT